MILKDTNEIFVDDLRDPAYAAGYLNIALEDDGIEGFLYALQKTARTYGISRVAEAADLSRESLYRSLSEKGNPGIKSLQKILGVLGLQVDVKPVTEAETQTDSTQMVEAAGVGANRRSDIASEQEIAAMRLRVQAEADLLRRQALSEIETTRELLQRQADDVRRLREELWSESRRLREEYARMGMRQENIPTASVPPAALKFVTRPNLDERPHNRLKVSPEAYPEAY